MNVYYNPDEQQWEDLTKRPVVAKADLSKIISEVFENVKNKGDEALKFYTKKFDGAELECLSVPEKEILEAENLLISELKSTIETAKNNIEAFHLSQIPKVDKIETTEGVVCWRENRAIEKVGIYIPGGTAPLFSTVLMLAIPATIAGCKTIVLCTPPDRDGNINPAILYAAKICGITEIFRIGGSQAIAALTFGTETIPKVYKIFGPGNQFVTAAKEFSISFGVAVDMPAGPSEVLVIADEQAVPEFCAADLLSQAEHGADSQVIFLCTDEKVFKATLWELQQQLKDLPRNELAEKSIASSRFILFDDIESCLKFSNLYAPEHLILAIKHFELYLEKIQNAGSVFLGNYACESAGDYASGTNHTLPTNGFAKNYSGVSLDSFVKKVTFQHLTAEGIKNLGKTIEVLADAEGLFAHRNAVTIRLNQIANEGL